MHNLIWMRYTLLAKYTFQFIIVEWFFHKILHLRVLFYFCEEYNKQGGLVEQRMRQAIVSVGSLWLTAWITDNLT